MLWDKLPQGHPRQVIYGDSVDETGLKIYTKKVGQAKQDPTTSTPSPQTPDPGPKPHHLRLYNLSMPTQSSLIARITYQRPRVSRSTYTGFYLAYHSPETEPPLLYTYHPLKSYSASPSAHTDAITQAILIPNLPHRAHRLVELGTYISLPRTPATNPDPAPLHLLTIQHISILPAPTTRKPSDHRITDLRIATRGEGPYMQKRLVWQFHSTGGTTQDGLPYSSSTGPFSYFLVSVDGRRIGRAYACEFALRREDFDGVEGGSREKGDEDEKREGEGEVVVVNVEGVLFGAGRVVGPGMRVRMEDVFG